MGQDDQPGQSANLKFSVKQKIMFYIVSSSEVFH